MHDSLGSDPVPHLSPHHAIFGIFIRRIIVADPGCLRWPKKGLKALFPALHAIGAHNATNLIAIH
jgi:hypothetical protein